MNNKIIKMHSNYQNVRKELNSTLELIEKEFKAAGLEFNRSDFRFTKQINRYNNEDRFYMSYNYRRISDLSKMNVYAELENKVNSAVKDLPNFNELTLKPRLTVGNDFFPIPNGVVSSVSTGQSTSINHNMGEVLVLEFWSVECQPCEAPMREMSDLLVKNTENWAGKARIVAICDEASLQSLSPVLTERNLTNLENYVLNDYNQGGLGSNLRYFFGASGVPSTMIVNKFGHIVYVGHPGYIDLESVVNYLVEEKEERFLYFARQKAIGGTYPYTSG
jgi:hypothetical protein